MNLQECERWTQETLDLHDQFTTKFSVDGIKKIVEYMDLTTLNATDSSQGVNQFVANGLAVLRSQDLPMVAAFCVFSNYASLVADMLADTGIETAVVASGFPYGQCPLNVKLLEIEDAVHNGATEVDVVIHRGMLLSGDVAGVIHELQAMKKSCGSAHMKVILEVSELNLSQVYVAANAAIEAGADFIKTSTGKGASGASLPASLMMCKAIKEHFERTGRKVGFKAAGGISTTAVAAQYIQMVGIVLGNEWLSPRWFRIGASSLLKNIMSDIQ